MVGLLASFAVAVGWCSSARHIVVVTLWLGYARVYANRVSSEAYDAVNIAFYGPKLKEGRFSALEHWQWPGIFKIQVMLEMSVLSLQMSAFIPPSPRSTRRRV